MSADATAAVHVGRGRDDARALERTWSDWGVDVPLVLLDGDDGDVMTSFREQGGFVVVIAVAILFGWLAWLLRSLIGS